MTERPAMRRRFSARRRWFLWPLALLLAFAPATLAYFGPSGAAGDLLGGGASSQLLPDQSPALTFTPADGVVGSDITLDGTGFTAGDSVTPSFGTTDLTCTQGTVDVTSGGTFTCDILVPASSAGSYVIAATTTTDGTVDASGSFVVDPAVTLAPTEGVVGSTTVLTGSGFTSGDAVVPYFNGGPLGCSGGSVIVESDGAFVCTITVPAAPAGANSVGAETATDGLVTSATEYTVVTALSLDPTSGSVGSTTTATGTGFASTSAVTFTFEGVAASSSCTSSSTGGFACAVTIPDVSAGTGTMIATDKSGNTADASFTVGAGITLDPTIGPVTTFFTVTGTGFDATASVTVSWDLTDTICSVTTGDEGGFSDCSANVPPSPLGSNTVTAREGSLTASATFTVNTSFNLTVLEGIPGTAIGLIGFGFEPSATYQYCLQSTQTACTSGDQFQSASNGSIPASTTYNVTTSQSPGSYFLDLSQGTTFVIAAPFVVSSVVFAISAMSGSVGTTVTLSGSELVAGDVYSFCFLPTITACVLSTTFTATSTGAIPAGTSLIVPLRPSGTYDVVLSQASTLVAALPFSLLASIALSTPAGPVGTFLTVNATGLDANATYALTWNGEVQDCGNVTGGEGGASCEFFITNASAGPTPVILTEGSLSPSAEFTVTPELESLPGNGPVATLVNWTGVGFEANALYSVSWNQSVVLCSGSSDGVGNFNCSAATPSAPAGTYTITASTPDATASSEWTVSSSLSLSPTSGFIGTNITATGEGYGSAAAYDVTWGGSQVLCTGTTGASGSFQCVFTLPVVPGGLGLVVGAEGTNQAGADFQVNPQTLLSASSGVVGASINVTGQGYVAASAVTVYWNGSAPMCTTVTTAAGTFSCAATIPTFPGGPFPIFAVQGASQSNTTFTVVPQFLVAPAAALVGTTVAATGTGFTALANFEVFWNSSTGLCSGTTDPLGRFSCNFVVPTSAPGSLSLFVDQGSYSPTFTFTVTSTAPSGSSGVHSPYFWWAVLAVGLLAAVILAIALLLEVRRHQRARSSRLPSGVHAGPLQPWGGGAGETPPHEAMDSAATAGATTAEPDDIDDLMSRLERVSQLRYKKNPKDLRTDEAPADPPARR